MDDETRKEAEEMRFLVVVEDGFQSIPDYVCSLPISTGWREISESICFAYIQATNDIVVERREDAPEGLVAFIATALAQDLNAAYKVFSERRLAWIASQN